MSVWRELDLIVIGDPTVDTFLHIHEAHVSFNIDPEREQLCIDYANKIPVDNFFRFPAGNSVNVAVSGARLGLKVAKYGMVGNDGDGHWIISELEKEGVDTKLMRIDKKKSTNYSTVLVFRRERTILIWHQDRDYELPALPQSEWLYFTSTGPQSRAFERLHKEVLGYLKSHDVKLAFNPGTYQLMLGRDGLKPFLERSEVVYLNKEETQGLTGKHTEDIKVLLRVLRDMGPKIAVVTDGPKGSYVYDGEKYFACGILDLPVVERTGAGDSFGSAFTVALKYGQTIPEAMRWGTFNSASVVGHDGGVIGLLRKSQMEDLSRKYPKLLPKEI
jgi:sugar/nucleoside kinase (ribokinase family)